ncbi:MAG: hypothetical protein MJE77_14735 [Proteobacteria bacterium]|nr:hypothetical protein [Pseudomonadota bacterium]
MSTALSTAALLSAISIAGVACQFEPPGVVDNGSGADASTVNQPNGDSADASIVDAQPVPGDDCSNAIDLGTLANDASTTLSGSTAAAVDNIDFACGQAGGQSDLVYQIRFTGSNDAEFILNPANWNAAIVITRSVCQANSAEEIVRCISTPNGATIETTISEPDTEAIYYIWVDGRDNPPMVQGSFSLSVRRRDDS